MMLFRQMSNADIPAVFDVRTSTVENAITMSVLEKQYGITPESVADAIQGSAKGWVCEVDDRIVGFAMGESTTGEVTVLAVLPNYEGRGIGKQLLAHVRDWLFDSGNDELWLLTGPNPNLRAYGFYLSQGWLATGDIVDDDEKFVLPRTC